MPISLKDVTDKMSTESSSSTLGWDVVVNYTEAQLNALLERSYVNNSETYFKVFNLVVVAYDEDENPYTVDIELKTGPPLISLVGSGNEPSCTLTFPVNGGHCKTADNQEPIPTGGYEIKLMNLDVASISGLAGGLNSSDSDKPAVFSSAHSGPATITMDFRASGELVVKLNARDNAPKNTQLETHKSRLEDRLFHFLTDREAVSSIQYQIATVAPFAAPAGSLELHPRAFRFAVCRVDQQAQAVLSIFVETSEGAGSGVQVDLQKEWQSKWAGWGVSPVPDSHATSIIFNHALVFKSIVVPAFERAGVNVGGLNFEQGKGHTYSVSTHKTVHRDASHDNYGFGTRWVSKIDVNLDDADKLLRITLGQNGNSDAHASMSCSWSFQYNLDYAQTQMSMPGHMVTYTGQANVKNVMNKVGTYAHSLTDEILRLEAGFGPEWAVDVTRNNDHLFRSMFGNDLPKFLYEILPSLTFSGELCFFPITNLFAPGQHLIAIDASAGLRVPRDFYLVGR